MKMKKILKKLNKKLNKIKFWRWNWRIWEWLFLPKLVREGRERTRSSHRENLKRLNKRGVGAREVQKIVDRLKIDHPDIDLSIKICDSWTSLDGIAMFATVEDIADGVVVITEFIEAGFDKVGETDENSDINCVDWKLRKSNGKKPIYISFRCFLSGETCKYVQIGVEEKPVMELRCGDEAVNLENNDDSI